MILRALFVSVLASLAFATTASAATLYAPAYFGPADNINVFTTASDGGLTPLAGSPFTVGAPLPNARGIGAMALTPDGLRGAVSYYFNGGAQGLSIGAGGDVAAAQPVVGTHQGQGLAVTPDGRFAYHGIYSATQGIDAYSIGSDGSLTAITGSPFYTATEMHDVAVAPDGSHAYASDGSSVRPFTIGADGSLTAMPAHVALGASNLQFTSDGRFLLVQVGSQTIGAMPVQPDGSLGAIVNTVTVGSTAVYVFTTSPDGRFMYAVDFNGDTLGQNANGDNQYSLNTYAIAGDGTLTLAGAGSTLPFRGRAIGISPDGRHAYLGTGSKIAVATLNANGVAGPFREVGDWNSGEAIPFIFKPVNAGAAQFAFSATKTPLTLDFSGAASTAPDGTVESYSWQFGDATSTSGPQPTTRHRFPAAGVYEVTLTATNEGCAARSLYNGHTTICNGSPAAAKTLRVDTPPWITSLKVSPSTIGSKTKIKFKLTEAATVTFAVQRPTTGRTVNGSCKKQTSKNRKAKKCTRWVTVGKKFTAKGKAKKTNSVKFTGSVKGRKLPRGSYRFSATGKDKAKGVGPAKTVKFKIRR